MLAALAAAAALGVAIFGIGFSLTPDRYLLVLLAPALVLRRGRLYLRDFVPFALLMLTYSEVRGLAHTVRPHPYYLPQLRAEQFLFGGTLPTEQLQHWLWSWGSAPLQWYDSVLLAVTMIHSIVPPALAFLLWLKRRALFYRFATTVVTLSFSAAAVFWIFPAAPPWMAGLDGLVPVIKIDWSTSSAPAHTASLSHFISANPAAAVPSLHAGYAFLVFLFVVTLAWRTRWRWLALAGVLYPAVQSFAVVYTGNHYVVDLLLGYVFATAAFLGVLWFWRRRAWPE